MTGPLSRSGSVERINENDGVRSNAHRGHWGRSVGTARLRLRIDKPLRVSARTLLVIALAAGLVILARPESPSLLAGAEPEITSPVNESQSGQDLTTTLTDQAELSLTVYNSDIALVRDVRNLQLARGIGNLRFMDIAATVNPATVHFRSLTEPSQVSVLEQNYEYDLLDPEKLLRKYVGRE